MSAPRHAAHQAIDGDWHVVYRSATGGLVSVAAGFPGEPSAQAEAQRLDRAASPAVIVPPPDQRPLVRGFYTDQDAA